MLSWNLLTSTPHNIVHYHWLLSHITIVRIERDMDPVAMTIINPSKEICQARHQSRDPLFSSSTQQEGHDDPVSLHWLIRKIPSYQTLQYLGIGLKHKTRNEDYNRSHSFYVWEQEDFQRFHYINPCKTCNPGNQFDPWVLIYTSW